VCGASRRGDDIRGASVAAAVTRSTLRGQSGSRRLRGGGRHRCSEWDEHRYRHLPRRKKGRTAGHSRCATTSLGPRRPVVNRYFRRSRPVVQPKGSRMHDRRSNRPYGNAVGDSQCRGAARARIGTDGVPSHDFGHRKGTALRVAHPPRLLGTVAPSIAKSARVPDSPEEVARSFQRFPDFAHSPKRIDRSFGRILDGDNGGEKAKAPVAAPNVRRGRSRLVPGVSADLYRRRRVASFSYATSFP